MNLLQGNQGLFQEDALTLMECSGHPPSPTQGGTFILSVLPQGWLGCRSKPVPTSLPRKTEDCAVPHCLSQSQSPDRSGAARCQQIRWQSEHSTGSTGLDHGSPGPTHSTVLL